jgi:menaquinol-cytochrome c reductase iron-sulfur subunit
LPGFRRLVTSTLLIGVFVGRGDGYGTALYSRRAAWSVISRIARVRKSTFMQRRTAFGVLVAAVSALAAGIVGLPTLIAGLSPAWQPRRETWRTVGRLQEFPVGAVTRATVAADRESWPRPYGESAVFVCRTTDADVVVFSQSCTDLGCPLEHNPGSGCYLCPCHGGIFDEDGRRLAGPPKSAMLRYAHRIREGVLQIDVASVPPAV